MKLNLSRTQKNIGRHQIHPVNIVMNWQGGIFEQGVRNCLGQLKRLQSHKRGEGCLGIDINQQYLMSPLSQLIPQILRQGCLTSAACLVK